MSGALPINAVTRGDCLEQMRWIPAGSVDCVLTDLPYGTTDNPWDAILPMDQLWVEWKRVAKRGAPIVLFTQQPFTTAVSASNLRQLKTEWIWVKGNATGFLNAKKYPLKAHENILVFCDRLPPYYPQKRPGQPYTAKTKNKRSSNYGDQKLNVSSQSLDGSRYPTTILTFKHERGLHPTQKPVKLLEYLIATYTRPGAVVLDCCIGSGSTGVAAHNVGRNFIGIERDPKYFAIAQARLAQLAPAFAEAA